MQSALVLLLTNLGTLARLCALLRAGYSGLLKRYPFFLLMTVLACALTGLFLIGRVDLYSSFWYATRWPAALLKAAAAIEAFWILAGHFRGIRNFGWWLIAAILGVSALAAALIGLIHVRWDSPMRDPVFADQYVSLWLMITAVASRAFFRQFRQFPIRPNAVVHVTLLGILFAAGFIGVSIGFVSAGRWTWAASLVLACGAIIVYGLWSLLMKPEGEELPFPPPPPKLPEDFDADEREHKRSVERIKRTGSQNWRRLFGW